MNAIRIKSTFMYITIIVLSSIFLPSSTWAWTNNNEWENGDSIDWNVPYQSQSSLRNWTTACMPTSGAMVMNFFYSGAPRSSFIDVHNTDHLWTPVEVNNPYSTTGQRIYSFGIIGGNNVNTTLSNYLSNYPKNGLNPPVYNQFYCTNNNGCNNAQYGPQGNEAFKKESGTNSSVSNTSVGTPGYITSLVSYLSKKHLIESVLLGNPPSHATLRNALYNGPVIMSVKSNCADGHIVVVKGVTANGKFIVNDPWNGSLCSHPGDEGNNAIYTPLENGGLRAYNNNDHTIKYAYSVPVTTNFNRNNSPFSPVSIPVEAALTFNYDASGQYNNSYNGDGDYAGIRNGFSYWNSNDGEWKYFYDKGMSLGFPYTATIQSQQESAAARWTPYFTEAGRYHVLVGFYVDSAHNSSGVTYEIYHTNGVDSFVIDQSNNDNSSEIRGNIVYKPIGEFCFNEGESRDYGSVKMVNTSDIPGDINVDIVRFVYLDNNCAFDAVDNTSNIIAGVVESVMGATVEIYEYCASGLTLIKSEIADEDGIFSFSSLEPEGDYQIVVKKNEYETCTQEVSITPTNPYYDIPITLLPKSSDKSVVKGVIKNGDGNAVKSATVELHGPYFTTSEPNKARLTDENGAFSFDDIETEGKYYIIVRKDGFSDHISDIFPVTPAQAHDTGTITFWGYESPPVPECPDTLTFDKGIIIPDNEVRFVEIPEQAIQGFLEDYDSVLKDIDLDAYELDPEIDATPRNGKSWSSYVRDWNLDELKNEKPTKEKYSPAKIIYLAAKENNVNPVLMLAYIQKENGKLMEMASPSPSEMQHVLNRAVGYGMKEGGDNPKYYGFLAQMTGLSYEVKLELPGFKKSYKKIVDDVEVNVKSAFAHFHYDYTPHLLSAENLFGAYKKYRTYFLGKGYSVCDGSAPPLPPVSDTDGDGLADEWERNHFGDLSQDGTGDFDGDGLKNSEEHEKGTDPTDSNDPDTVTETKFRNPVDGHNYVTSYFDHSGKDWNGGTKRYAGHKGTDFGIGGFPAMDKGVNVVATADGKVIKVIDGKYDRCIPSKLGGSECKIETFGNYIKISHSDGKVTIYGHLRKNSIKVKEGDEAECGQVIAQVGSSGHSSGPHLHFEVKTPEYGSDDPFAGEFSGPLSYWTDQGEYGRIPSAQCADGSEPPPVIVTHLRPAFVETMGERKNGNIRIIPVEADGITKSLGLTGTVKMDGTEIEAIWTSEGIKINSIYSLLGICWDTFVEPVHIEVEDENGDEIVNTYYPFSDIGQDVWYTRPVMKLWKEGVVSGYADTKSNAFVPNQTATRAEYVTVALVADEAANHPGRTYPSYTNIFNDVNADDWFAKYVQYAKTEDIIQGCDPAANLFCPTDSINRAEAATITTKTFDRFQATLATYDDDEKIYPGEFSDVTDNNDWFYSFIYTAKEEGIVSGYSDGTFKPAQAVNRAEMAVMNCIAAFGESACTFMGELDTPLVTLVFPQVAALNQKTFFTVLGNNLPDTTAFWIEQCENVQDMGGNENKRQFSCVPSHSAGTKKGFVKDQTEGRELSSFTLDVKELAPVVNSVTPTSAMFEQKTTFTVKGENLPDTTAFWIGECAGLENLGGTSAERRFSCTPSYTAGVKQGAVKDMPDGNLLREFTVSVQAVPAPETPTVTSVSPLSATFNQKTTFTVKGSNLPDTTAFWIAHCASLENLGGSSGERKFRCTPKYETGYQDGAVKDQKDGNELRLFRVNVQPESAPPVTPAEPKVISVSPSDVTIDKTTIFTVTGENLPDTTAFFIAECAELEKLGGDETEQKYRCIPSYTIGSKWGVVKDQPGGTELYKFDVKVRAGTPKVTSVEPTRAYLNQPTTFTVTGTSLIGNIAFFIAECEGVTTIADDVAEERIFRCTPSHTPGTKWGVVKDRPGGTELLSFDIDIYE